MFNHLASKYHHRLRQIKSQVRAERVRVLRNVYTLLALVLAPGALGVYLGMIVPLAAVVGFWVALGVFLLAFWGLSFLIYKHHTSGYSVVWAVLLMLSLGYFTAPVLEIFFGAHMAFKLALASLGGAAGVFITLAAIVQFTKFNFAKRSFYLALALGGMFVLVLVGGNDFWADVPVALLLLGVFLLVFLVGNILSVAHRTVNSGENNYVVASMVPFLLVLGWLRERCQRVLAARPGR